MIIECINCNKRFEVNSELIPSSGRTIQCGSCNHIWFFDPQKIASKNNQKIPKQTPSQKKTETNKIIKKKVNISESKDKKNYEITKYKAKTRFSLSKFLSYIQANKRYY